MAKLYFKRQMNFWIFYAGLLCVIFSIWQFSRIEAGLPFRKERKEFIEEHADEWGELATTLYHLTIQKESELHDFQNYPIELERDEMDICLDWAALLWLEEQYIESENYTGSLSSDVDFFSGLSMMAQSGEQMLYSREQRLLRCERNIERYRNDQYLCALYGKLLENTEKIETATISCSTLEAEAFFSYWKTDFAFCAIVLMSSFAGMTEFIHGNAGKQMLISPSSLKVYILKQYMYNLLSILALHLIYAGIIFAIWQSAAFPKEVLELPIQVIGGCQDVIFPMSVGQYLIFLIAAYDLVYVSAGAIIQFISVLSANTTISFSLSALFLGSVSYVVLSGLAESMTEGLPYISVCRKPIEKYYILIIGCCGILIICGGLIGLLVTARVRKCVRKQ
jgi:hypothetical protein